MPLRKFRRRFRRPVYAKRKYAARRRRYVRARRVRPRMGRRVPLGIPLRRFVKLRYVDTVTLDAISGGLPVAKQYRCNSIWDPEVSAGGKKPLYTDHWASMYSNFVVCCAVMRARWIPNTTGNILPGVAGIVQGPDGTVVTGTDVHDLLAGKFTSRPTIVGTSVGIVNRPQVLKSVWRRRKFFPATTAADPDQIGIITPSATGGSNPVKQAMFNLFYGDLTGVDPGPVVFVVTIDYYALLWNIDIDEVQPALDVGELAFAESTALREVSALPEFSVEPAV